MSERGSRDHGEEKAEAEGKEEDHRSRGSRTSCRMWPGPRREGEVSTQRGWSAT